MANAVVFLMFVTSGGGVFVAVYDTLNHQRPGSWDMHALVYPVPASAAYLFYTLLSVCVLQIVSTIAAHVSAAQVRWGFFKVFYVVFVVLLAIRLTIVAMLLSKRYRTISGSWYMLMVCLCQVMVLYPMWKSFKRYWGDVKW